MLSRVVSRLAIAAAIFVLACSDSSSSPSHAPVTLKIVSGNNQFGDVSTALDSALVVQVVDGSGKPVSGVALNWTASGGGTLSVASTTTDGNGQSTEHWTLAPTIGTQVVTVTSSAISGASVSFVATNGTTITGSATIDGTQSPFILTSRRPARPLGFAASRIASPSGAARQSTAPAPRYTRNRIIVGFKDGALGVATAGSMSYRSMATAQATAATIHTKLSTLMRGRSLSAPTVSPALLAARLRVDDVTQMQSIMDSLRADPSVAYVEREAVRGIPKRLFNPANSKAWAANILAAVRANGGGPVSGATSVATNLPNDPYLFLEYWNYNMLDLPRTWAITTGTSAVTVAVVDMGIRFDHPGIAANLTKDGYDFVSQTTLFDLGLAADSTPQAICGGGTFTTIDGDGDGPDPDPTDPNDLDFDDFDNCWQPSTAGDHGLWTAGIIGEVGNDGQYGNGVNWTVRIRPIRALGVAEGVGTDFDIAQAILYAAGLPAPGAGGKMVQGPRSAIINMSLGGEGSSDILQSAVASAVSAGSLIVAAAGNDQTDVPFYPAAYSGVMAVSAVGPDGTIASYSNAGQYVSVAAPGGDTRLDDPFDDPFNEFGSDTGGSLVWGLWWDFTTSNPTFAAADGTSAAAPHVAGIAALVLGQNPSMSATDLRSRIEQTATRPIGASRNDTYGWGVVNAFRAVLGPSAPTRALYARLIASTTGTVIKTVKADANGNFAFANLGTSTYFVQAGEDEGGDATIGVPGRRFNWAGGFGAPTLFAGSSAAQTTSILVGMPTEIEPNDDTTSANRLSVGSYVIGSITSPDVRDVYRVVVPVTGVYTFQTTGLVGSCGLGPELDTFLAVTSSTGSTVASNDNDRTSISGPFCSRVQASLAPGTYYVTVTPSSAASRNFTASVGRYRLEFRAGT